MDADLGLLGGGQLARMTIQAAQKRGLTSMSIDPGRHTPASACAPALVGSLDDPESLAQIFMRCRRVTLENEFIPAGALRAAMSLSRRDPECLIPGPDCLEIIQDKLKQREALSAAGVPSPKAMTLEGTGASAVAELGFPMVLKSRFGGYDGKGTIVVSNEEELAASRSRWGWGDWLAEAFVPFRRELAVMVAVTPHSVVELETVETQQRDCVCDVTYPAKLWGEIENAGEVAIAAVRAVGGLGLFGVELFELESGEIWVNEIAPRPHNTGHYSLDWGDLSQFEIHARLAMGLPLPAPGDGKLKGRSVYMINLFGVEGAGDFRNGLARALETEPSARVHWYEKAEARPGRKMGHINLVARHDEPPHTMLPLLHRVRDAFYDGWRLTS